MTVLADHHRGPSPFIKLNSLRIVGYNFDDPQPARFDILFGSTLRTLEVATPSSDGHLSFSASLTYLPCASPGLENLSLTIGHPLAMAHLEQLIIQLPNLKDFTLLVVSDARADCTLSHKCVTSLSALRNLHTLTTSYSCPTLESSAVQPDTTRPTFPSLRSLQLHVDTHHQIALWSSFIQFYELVSLADLQVYFTRDDHVLPFNVHASLKAMMCTVCDVVSHSALRSVFIHNIYTTFDVAIQPLLPFTGLEKVVVCLVSLEDHECSTMATAWPKLLFLATWSILADEQLSTRSLPLASLAHFARHCPMLERLRVQIDTAVVPPLLPRSRSQRMMETPRLKSLEVCRSMLSAESRAPVAVFLVDHFPKLEDVCATRIPGDEVTDRWSDVQGMLAGLSRAREVWGQA